jgi:hypothetical protein
VKRAQSCAKVTPGEPATASRRDRCSRSDYDALGKAWAESGKWAKEVAQFRYQMIESIRLGSDPSAPVLPENMSLRKSAASLIFGWFAPKLTTRTETDAQPLEDTSNEVSWPNVPMLSDCLRLLKSWEAPTWDTSEL